MSSASSSGQALPCGIYPYVGGSASVGDVQAAVREYGYVTVSGASGVKLANDVKGTLADPAQYAPRGKIPQEPNFQLFDYDEWLERQRQAKVPVVLTDSTRIQKRDRASLRSALMRWRDVGHPTLAVLPVETWWLKEGLPCLIDEVQTAHRPVALVLHHLYNGLDAATAVAGLVTFIAALGDIPVVLLRVDVSGVGAVAHGGHAAFLGISATNRHGPMPRRPKPDKGDEDEPDLSPAVFVPALHDYVKASRLPAITRDEDAEVLACHDDACQGASLLRFSRLSDVDLKMARAQVYRHNMASHEKVAQTVLSSDVPKDVWWELCKSGADTAASLIERGVSLSVSRWLRQWLELGSPSHAPVSVP